EHLPDAAPAGGRTVLVVEYSPRLADHIERFDVASLSSSRRDVTVVVCTGGRLGDRAPQRSDIEVITDADLAWDQALATEGLERRGRVHLRPPLRAALSTSSSKRMLSRRVIARHARRVPWTGVTGLSRWVISCQAASHRASARLGSGRLAVLDVAPHLLSGRPTLALERRRAALVAAAQQHPLALDHRDVLPQHEERSPVQQA